MPHRLLQDRGNIIQRPKKVKDGRRKSFIEAILKGKSQFKLFKDIGDILERVGNSEEQQEIILERIEFKKMSMNSIQIALHNRWFNIVKILLNKIDQRDYLETYELLEQAIKSMDDNSLGEMLKIYLDESIDIDPQELSETAQRCLKEGSWNQDTIKALYPYMRSSFIPRAQKKAKMYAFVCYNTFNVETEGQRKRDGAKEEADCIIKGRPKCFGVRL